MRLGINDNTPFHCIVLVESFLNIDGTLNHSVKGFGVFKSANYLLAIEERFSEEIIGVTRGDSPDFHEGFYP